MNARPFGRLWPQKVRTRLTLSYATLFFVAGSALLGLTYGLVASNLPTRPPASLTISSQEVNLLQQACKSAGAAFKSKHQAPGTPRLSETPPQYRAECKRAQATYYAGTAAGMQAQRQQTLSKLLGYPLLGLGVMTVASGGLGWFMSGQVLRPVRVITETARRSSERHLGERLALDGARDELKELADTFDDMLERLDRAFATQRRFVANASHELRTPLTMMRTAIDVTLAKPSPTARQLTGMAARVRNSIDRAETMTEALLTLAVSDQGKLAAEFTDLATWAEDAIDAAAPDIERLNLKVDTELDPAETTGPRSSPGPARGIGLAVTRTLAAEGGRVAGAARTITSELEQATAVAVLADLNTRDEAMTVVEQAIAPASGIDPTVDLDPPSPCPLGGVVRGARPSPVRVGSAGRPTTT